MEENNIQKIPGQKDGDRQQHSPSSISDIVQKETLKPDDVNTE